MDFLKVVELRREILEPKLDNSDTKRVLKSRLWSILFESHRLHKTNSKTMDVKGLNVTPLLEHGWILSNTRSQVGRELQRLRRRSNVKYEGEFQYFWRKNILTGIINYFKCKNLRRKCTVQLREPECNDFIKHCLVKTFNFSELFELIEEGTSTVSFLVTTRS